MVRSFVCACVRACVRVECGCLLPSIYSVRFGELLLCAHKSSSKGRTCMFN